VCISMVFGALVPVELLSSCLLNCNNMQPVAYGYVNYNQSTKRNNFAFMLIAVWLQKLKVRVADNRESSESLSPFFTF
jgi:hypothetical protein